MHALLLYSALNLIANYTVAHSIDLSPSFSPILVERATPRGACQVRFRPSSDSQCKIRGYIETNPGPTTSYNDIAKFARCRNLCLDNPDNCSSFSYNYKTKVCRTFALGVAELGVKKPKKTSTEINDASCYELLFSQDVVNGDFEDDSGYLPGWQYGDVEGAPGGFAASGYNTDGGIDGSRAYSGQSFAQSAPWQGSTGSTTTDAYIMQDLYLCSGNAYRVTYSVRLNEVQISQNAFAKAFVAVSLRDDSGVLGADSLVCYATDDCPTGEWSTRSFNVPTLMKTKSKYQLKMQLSSFNSSSILAYVDDISIEVVTPT